MVSLHYSTHIICRLACCSYCVQHFFVLCRQNQCLFLKVRDCVRRKPTSYGVWKCCVNLIFFLRATFQELREGQDYQPDPMLWTHHILHVPHFPSSDGKAQLHMFKWQAYKYYIRLFNICKVTPRSLELISFLVTISMVLINKKNGFQYNLEKVTSEQKNSWGACAHIISLCLNGVMFSYVQGQIYLDLTFTFTVTL